MVAMTRSRPPQRPQLNTSTSKALAMSWAHVQFRRAELGSATRAPGASGAGTGLGAQPRSRKRKNSPSSYGFSSVHCAMNAAGSRRRDGRARGTARPRISSSSRHQPTPTPQMSRPFESASMLVSIFAITTGCR